MAANRSLPSRKRKRVPGGKEESHRVHKSPKKHIGDKPDVSKISKPKADNSTKIGKLFKHKFNKGAHKRSHAKAKETQNNNANIKPDAKSKKSSNQAWKELTEKRKRKRKRYYDLEKELVVSWEKMRQRNIEERERSKLISEILNKMKGKIPDIAGSHVSSRVLQTCVKYCEKAEKDSIYEELRPHFLTLARNTYAVHLLTKMLDHANKEQLQQILSSLQGHVATFLRHPVGSTVVEHAFKLANETQKQDLVSEIYHAEFRLFKGIIPRGKGRLVDLLSGQLASKKSAVLEHMTAALQPILEKGIVDHSIVHRVLIEYLSIANKSSVTDVIQQLSGPLLVRMIHTSDGSKVGELCVMQGSPKERKRIVKGMKGHILKIAQDEYGSRILMCILSFVEDTNLVIKAIIREFEKNLKELALNKYGQRLLLYLLCPNSPRYHTTDALATLSSMASISPNTMGESPKNLDDDHSGKTRNSSETNLSVHINDRNNQKHRMEDKDEEDTEEGQCLGKQRKKDPALRISELLGNGGLAQKLTQMCIQNARELLCSRFGKDIIFEMATGGTQGIIWKLASEGVTSLHRAIADLGALPKEGMETEEHVFVQYHSSRTIRRLILECRVPDDIEAPSFAAILWDVALKGKCKTWAQGHSEKVVSALLECGDVNVKNMAKAELQPLIDAGLQMVANRKHL